MRNVLLLALILVAAEAQAQTAGTAGAFARMGFGARGMGMGNAMTAVITGDPSTYYNPAVAAFAAERTAGATFGVLSLDRTLNFLSYTQAIKPQAGLSFGLINSGVRNIDGRDADGNPTGPLSTFEDQFYFSFSNRVADALALGVTIKLYYSQLYDQVKSSTVGFDLGGLYRLTDRLSVGLAVQDINSKYKWDSKPLYDLNGRTTEDDFPTLYRLGAAYALPDPAATLSAEFERSSAGTTIVRAGVEVAPVENFAVRGGIDRGDFSTDATGIKPSFGFRARNSFNGWTPALDYAYVIESFAPNGMHILTLSVAF